MTGTVQKINGVVQWSQAEHCEICYKKTNQYRQWDDHIICHPCEFKLMDQFHFSELSLDEHIKAMRVEGNA